jgi:menaquinone-dependent protoporphyrinogen IX oxidase
MKSLVIYYSHYGNTSFAVYYLLRILEKMGTADIMRLEYAKGQRNPIMRLIYKIAPLLVELKPVTSNLKEYDTLCLGIPVIAARPSSAISKYISSCKNLEGKNIVCCYVYGFEANAKRCANRVRKILKRKSQSNIFEVFVPWNLAHNDKELDGIIGPALSGLMPKP